MKNLNLSTDTHRRNGVLGVGLVPGYGASIITIKVSHGQNQYEVSVPFNSTFGYLKSVICQKMGLNPGMHKLLFGRKERDNDEFLHAVGVTDNCEVLLIGDTPSEQNNPNAATENPVISKGEEAVAEVRKEVDKLEQQVSALQASVDGGTKVDDKEIVYLTEMLMRQLLKLDDIEADGEGRAQRRKEVRRVQSIVDKLDALKARNSNNFTNTPKNLPTSTHHQEARNPGSESMNSVTTQWESFDSCASVNVPMSSYDPPPHYTPPDVSYYTPYPPNGPYYAPYPPNVPYYSPHPPDLSYHNPFTVPYYAHYPMPPPAPYPMPPHAPHPAPPSSEATRHWEHFT